MKILLTGGCGFIGSNLVRLLMNQTDHSVVNCDKLTYAGVSHSLSDLDGHSRYQHMLVDIADHQAVGKMIDETEPDSIMHLAAESHVDRSISGPSDFVQTNVVGTFNLLDHSRRYIESLSAERRRAFRFLQVSTDEVFGSLGATGKFDELSRYAPHSPYAATKASADHLVRAWHDTYGLPVIITNCSNNFGPYQLPEKMIPLMIIKCLLEQPLTVYGNGENVRDWLYVQDHCNALLLALTKGTIGETYCIGGDCERQNIDLVHAICDIMDTEHPRRGNERHCDLICFVKDRPGHDFRYAIDSSKAQRDLQWEPLHSLETSLKRTVQWYLNNQSWWQQMRDLKSLLKRPG